MKVEFMETGRCFYWVSIKENILDSWFFAGSLSSCLCSSASVHDEHSAVDKGQDDTHDTHTHLQAGVNTVSLDVKDWQQEMKEKNVPVTVLIMNKVSDQTVEADHSKDETTFQDIIYIFYLLTLYYLSPVNLMCNS